MYMTTREIYKKVKKFDHAQFDRFCTNIYQEGYKNGKESVKGIEATDVMSAVKDIKGIGEKRLSQIESAITQLMEGGEKK